MIDPERWNLVGDLFDQALALSAAERNAFLEDACGSDVALRDEVLSLLKHSAGTDSLLDGVATDAIDVVRSVDRGGHRLGPYLLIKRIGQGGMGEVYLAERADGQFEQQVALKLVRSGLSSDQALARFSRERQILARLQHPYIARLLDGGVTEDGRPYFVMEYVAGTPIDEYADAQHLSAEERLQLFTQICKAVTYAHANLIVHRDLKPSNILVTESGEVKLLDFGIAKVLSEEEGDLPGITQTGFGAMTPAYASPEQARGEPIGTSTDIYSLGVVLYELLTGIRPYEVSGQQPLEAARVICEVDPDRPSTALSEIERRTGVHPDHISQSRGTNPSRLRRMLAGDLDVICLKALRKEPARRYKTADEMGDDIDRHLKGRPIEARAESTVYRLGKYLRRNQVAVAIALTLLITSSVLAFLYTTKLQLAVAEAEGAASFLTEVFAEAHVTRQGSDVTVVEAASVAAETVLDSYQDNPSLRARIQTTLGVIFGNISDADRSFEMYQSALASSEEAYGTMDVRTTGPRYDLIASLVDRRDYTAAESLLVQNIQIKPSALDRGKVLYYRAIIAERNGELDQAEALYRQSIDLLSPIPNTDVQDSKMYLANLLSDQDRFDEAIALYNEIIATAVQDGEVQSGLNWYRMELAYAYAESRQDRLAIETYEQLLPDLLETHGPDHMATYLTRSNMAQVYGRLGMYEQACAYSLDALETKTRLLGESNPSTVIGLVYYGEILALTNIDEARPYFEQALATADTAWPDGN